MGGGGKGMRVVGAHAELAEAVTAARREAAAAFGDGTVFLERYITDARHVEIQVLADGHGGLVHCFERECSIQRRHQKIIEECPSPAVDPGLRGRMGAAALAAAKAVGYLGAGTVEFVLEPSGDFWFLEVNTRLQVEHPVTEAVTGIDLVREQLLVAQGLPLSVTQDGLAIDGHAIEARLYAEDPAAGFLPATGTLVDWCPATAPPCRWDTGVTAGSVVGVEFDPMLAKVIAHAPTRAEAALALALALQRSRIRGVTTNRDFLVAALRHPDFLAGRTTTSFIERSAVPLARQPAAAELRAAAIGAALAAQAAARAAAPVLATLPSGWRNTVMPPEQAEYRHGQDTVAVSYARQRDGRFAVTVTGAGLGPDGAPEPGEPGRGGPAAPGAAAAGSGSAGSGSAGPGSAAPGPAATSATPGAPAPPPSLVTVHHASQVTVHHAGDGWIDFDTGGRRHRLHVLAAGDQVWVQGPDGDVALTAVPRFPEAERGEARGRRPGRPDARDGARGARRRRRHRRPGPAPDDRGGHEDGAPDHRARTPGRSARSAPGQGTRSAAATCWPSWTKPHERAHPHRQLQRVLRGPAGRRAGDGRGRPHRRADRRLARRADHAGAGQEPAAGTTGPGTRGRS